MMLEGLIRVIWKKKKTVRKRIGVSFENKMKRALDEDLNQDFPPVTNQYA